MSVYYILVMVEQTLHYQGGWTALMLAASDGHTSVVETLLQHKSSTDIQNEVSTDSQSASKLY